MLLSDAIPQFVIVDPERRRFFVLLPDELAAELKAEINDYVEFRMAKSGERLSGSDEHADLPKDPDGWRSLP